MKTLFFLFITLFFATIAFAENSQISNIASKSDDTNKKIEKIEEKLDTTKEELIKYTQITEDMKERIGDISGSVDRFTTALTIFGFLVTIGLIIVAWSSRNSAISEAKNTAEEVAQSLFDRWVKEKKKDFEKKEEHFEKIMNDKIKLFEDNVDVKTIQIMYENAVGYDRNKQYTEALKIYDEIISSYGNSQNETIIMKVALSTAAKGFVLYRLDKPDESFEVYKNFIFAYKDSKIDRVIKSVVNTIQNKLELEIILDKPISDNRILIKNLNYTPREMAIIDMLFILQNAKSVVQDEQIVTWSEQYQDIKVPTWEFDELEGWIEKATYPEDVKARIQSYIEKFKTHLHRV